MARYKDPIVTEVLSKQLHPGEQLQHFAYGVRQPNMGLVILLVCLAILPGLIAVALLTKEYVVGLTSNRLLILRVKGGKATVQEITEYDRRQLPPSKTSTGGLFTHIRLMDPGKPFYAKFHRMGMKNNREHAMAIAAALPSALPPAKVA
jgi:hypothetical protein